MKLQTVLATSIGALAICGAAHAATDYTLVTAPDTIAEGDYGVATLTGTLRTDGAWGDYSAPDGVSPFEIFNAATLPGERFWYDSKTVTAGDTYRVKLVVANNYPVSAPVIQFSVDGVDTGAAQTLGGPYGTSYTGGVPGPWKTIYFTFNAATSGPVVLALIDTNTDAGGNDFSVASVSAGVPEPAAWALMMVGVFSVGSALRLARRREHAVSV